MPRIRAESIAEHKELTRRKILEAARSNFLEFGYPETALGDIALDADIGRTTLYEYFPDKEAVLIALVKDELPSLLDDILGTIPDGLNARERIAELVRSHLTFIADESNLGTMLMRDSNKLSGTAQHEIREAHRDLETAIVAAFQDGVDAGEFRQMEPRVAGELINAATMYGARTLLRSKDPQGEVDAVTATIVEFLFHGLATS